MLGNPDISSLQELIDCLYPPDGATSEQCEDLERQALSIIQKQPTLLAEHSVADSNMTPLLAAIWDPARCCSLATFKMLLQKPTDVNAVKDFNIRAIHYLARYNRNEHLQALLSAKKLKVEVNAVTDAGDTAVSLAALEGANHALASLIVMGKVDVNIPNAQGQTPLHVACFFGQPEGGKRETPISLELAGQYLSCINLLLQAGAKVDARDQFGSTPVHILSSVDIPSEIKLRVLNDLIESGADLTIKAKNQFDAAQMSEGYQFTEFSENIKRNMVPSLRLLATRAVIESGQDDTPGLFDDFVRMLSRFKLGMGSRDKK